MLAPVTASKYKYLIQLAVDERGNVEIGSVDDWNLLQGTKIRQLEIPVGAAINAPDTPCFIPYAQTLGVQGGVQSGLAIIYNPLFYWLVLICSNSYLLSVEDDGGQGKNDRGKQAMGSQ